MALIFSTAVNAAEFPSYSAVDNVQFSDPFVSCEGLHNEDDCHIWRIKNNFDDKWTNYDPCGSFDAEMERLVAVADARLIEELKEKALAVKPAAGSNQ